MLTPWTGIPSLRCSPFCSKQKLCPWCAWHRYRSVPPGAGQTTIATGVKKEKKGQTLRILPLCLSQTRSRNLIAFSLEKSLSVALDPLVGPRRRFAGWRSRRPQPDAEWRRIKRGPDILLLACVTCTELRSGGAIIGGNIIYRRLQGH